MISTPEGYQKILDMTYTTSDPRNLTVKNLKNFFVAGNPIKMSSYKDPSYRNKSPTLDEHRNKILKEFNLQ